MRIPETPPPLEDLLTTSASRIVSVLGASGPLDPKGRYLHWDEMRNRNPPEGLTLEDWWLGTALSRRGISRLIPLVATNGRACRFSNVDAVQESVHRIDQQAGGQIQANELVMNPRSNRRYLISSLVEEAITSSQLEGASTTRQVAKELLATGRRPRNRSEQMIVNNYYAMMLASELADEGDPLTPAAVLHLHRVVTENAIDDPKDAGRLQAPGDERVAVYWPQTGALLHQPPPAEELPERLATLCRFANGEIPDGFIHPVVRAIIVHYWLAYDHPFVDGNGRTARALFYWTMLRNGYWLTKYVSISSILRKAPAKYARSYLLAETDDHDVTYFVIYQLRVIERAIKSLHEYLGRKIEETREIETMLHGSTVLNHRQLVVVHDALRDPSEPFTIGAQARRHNVTYESARSDLLKLEDLGLLAKDRVGKKYVFHAQPDLGHRLKALGAAV